MTAADSRCQHVPTSPGQSMCRCMDEIMHLRWTVHHLSREVDRLSTALDHHDPQTRILDGLGRPA